MTQHREPLTAFKIRDYVDGEKITKFEQALRKPNSLESWDLRHGLPFEGRLFLQVPEARKPAWGEFLADGIEGLVIPDIKRVNAVLFVKIYDGEDKIFAFTFGYGRYLLRPDCYEINYGLRVALNILYDKSNIQYEKSNGNLQPERIKSVDSKTVAEKTIRTRRQTDRRATFETFGVDIQRDLLRAVTGAPISSDVWGSLISGSDSVSINPALSFEGLGNLCKDISQMHSQKIYEDNFKWIDNLRVITDFTILKELQEMLVDAIKAGSDNVRVTVPEFVEWDNLSEFYFSFDSSNRFPDPENADLRGALAKMGKLDMLTFKRLRRSWQLKAVAVDGSVTRQWPLLKCLAGEFTLDDCEYILTEGEFFEIQKDYIEELDAFIKAMKPTKHSLVESTEKMKEKDYNIEAVKMKKDGSYLLLDMKTVHVNGMTGPIEICDILTDCKCFIHVKRELGSSTLSHLFAQGWVSADLFLMSKEYRIATLKRIQKEEKVVGRFSSFIKPDGIVPSDYEVSYAIVAKWNGRDLAQALPFFSKVNLRRHVEDLNRMGYQVTIARVKVS